MRNAVGCAMAWQRKTPRSDGLRGVWTSAGGSGVSDPQQVSNRRNHKLLISSTPTSI